MTLSLDGISSWRFSLRRRMPATPMSPDREQHDAAGLKSSTRSAAGRSQRSKSSALEYNDCDEEIHVYSRSEFVEKSAHGHTVKLRSNNRDRDYWITILTTALFASRIASGMALPYPFMVILMSVWRIKSFWIPSGVPLLSIHVRYVWRNVCQPTMPRRASLTAGMM